MVRSARIMPPGPSVSAMVCFQAVALADGKIGDRTGLIAANLESDHNEIGTLQVRFYDRDGS